MTAIAEPTRDDVVADNSEELAADSRRERWFLLGLTLPSMVVIAGVLFAPLAWLIWQSFVDKSGHFTLDHFLTLFSEPKRIAYLQNTFLLSAEVTVIAATLAYPLCFALTTLPERLRKLCLFFVIVPLLTSVLVRTYAWLIILGTRGIINSSLLHLGLIEEPLNLVYNYFCTLVGMVHVMTPLIVLPLYAAMRSIDGDLVRAASSLGATPRQAFWGIFLPLTLPGLYAGATLVFVLSLGYYVTPSILGGGKVIVWAIFLEQLVAFNQQWGPSAAAGLLLLVATMVVLIFARFVAGVRVNQS